MKLDFNFRVKSWVGDTELDVKEAMLLVFQNADVKEAVFLEKIGNWAESVKKNGSMECDVPDANYLIQLLMKADVIAMGKFPLKQYIDKRISDTKT